MKLSHPLYAATAVEGGETTTADPDAMKGWMAGLGNLDTPAEPEKEPDGKTAEVKSDAGAKAGAVDAPGGNGAAAVDSGAADGKGTVAAKADVGKDAAAKEAAPDKAAEEEKWPRTSKDWDSFKAKRRENEEKFKGEIAARDKELADLKTRLQELDERGAKLNEPPPEVKAQIDRLTKENEEMSLQLQVLEVTAHPKFKAYFENKTNAQIALAKRIVGPDAAEQIEAVLKMPDIPELMEIKQAKLEELVAELSPMQQSRIGSVLNALTEIGEERTAEIARANEHKAAITGKQSEQQKAQQEEAVKVRDAAWSETLKSLQDEKKGMPAFQLREGDDAWNASVGKRIDLARRYFGGHKDLKPADIARASFAAAAVPDLLASYQADMAAKDKEIATLNDQVKKLTAAQPGKGSTAEGGDEGLGGGRVQLRPEMTPAEATAAWMKVSKLE